METTRKKYRNCLDYGHNLRQINPSTQINVAYDVASSFTPNITMLSHKNCGK